MSLSEDERSELLMIARKGIEAAMDGRSVPEPVVHSEMLQQPHGVFVTLRIDGELRGCIGYVEPQLPLASAVQEVAQKAAFEDPRFSRLSETEFAQVEIEISVLSPLVRVSEIQEIEVGKHGLVIDAGFTRGLLLPQVPTAYHWDREQFLRHTAIKAGLPPEAWQKSGVRLFTFTTETFGSHAPVNPS
jgi:AmmeMemoRadiSam system protein A